MSENTKITNEVMRIAINRLAAFAVTLFFIWLPIDVGLNVGKTITSTPSFDDFGEMVLFSIAGCAAIWGRKS